MTLRILLSKLTTAHADRGRERYRRIGMTASTSMLSQALAVAISLISVPLTIRYLGPERYGVWLTISSLLTWMAVTDFGIGGNALVNLISEANGIDDRSLARNHTASAFWVLSTIAFMAAVVTLATFSHIPWRTVFRVSSAVPETELRLACGLTLAIFAIGFPLNMLNSVYNGYQDGFVANLWTVAGNLLALTSLICVAQFQGGLVPLVFAISGTRVLVSGASALYLFSRRYPWLAPSPAAVRWTSIKRLVSLGLRYMTTQLAGLGIYQSQPMLITQLLGPSKVIIFVVAQKIITLPHGVVFMATQPLVAAYAEANARRDWPWIRHALKRSMIAATAFGVLSIGCFALVAQPVIRMWAGPGAVPDPVLILLLSAYTFISILTLPPAQMLNGLERVGVPALGLTLCAAVTIGLGIVAARYWGLNGLALAMCGGLLITYSLALIFELRRVLRGHSNLHAPLEEPCELRS